MGNIDSHINVIFFQKTTGRSRERSASLIYLSILPQANVDILQELPEQRGRGVVVKFLNMSGLGL